MLSKVSGPSDEDGYLQVGSGGPNCVGRHRNPLASTPPQIRHSGVGFSPSNAGTHHTVPGSRQRRHGSHHR